LSSKDFQKWIGYDDVKSAPVHFYVQRNSKFHQKINSISFRFGAGERGKRHEFDVGDIHGTATGNLFFPIYGTGEFSTFII
jgi:hypothetical protein